MQTAFNRQNRVRFPGDPPLQFRRGSGQHAARRPFPFALFFRDASIPGRCSPLLTDRIGFDSQASHHFTGPSSNGKTPAWHAGNQSSILCGSTKSGNDPDRRCAQRNNVRRIARRCSRAAPSRPGSNPSRSAMLLSSQRFKTPDILLRTVCGRTALARRAIDCAHPLGRGHSCTLMVQWPGLGFQTR
jgi:hypothetical protein